ncbi:LppP/LprE family lipoprotein [Gordonia sp. HY002]|uniref:LppP/LprE family lipoprotein n=1 Tax=Gordonia zhenghanii TaxID=2911516 RepID=UPI001EF0A46A|nr:LppP/LprE family lipoprotein [Gordonia zhenghanii]MCF8570585.1 LppP/LprE family lipoprotein [Gordonia zhenghanii]MCF8606616.1 LppP/LprE family lipoprotein [Gordonia zhenghanii]
MRKLATAAVVATCIVVTVTGCRDSDHADRASDADQPQSTSSRDRSTASPTSSTPAVDRPVTAGPGGCLDLGAATVVRAVSSIDAYGGQGFVASEGTRAELGSCPELMWANADLKGGTGSSPQRILFFDAGGFIRYDTEAYTAFTSVLRSTSDSVVVRYRWLDGGDSTANPTGGPVDVTYTLSGQNVIADRTIPDRALVAPPSTETVPIPDTTPNTVAPQAPDVAAPPTSETPEESTTPYPSIPTQPTTPGPSSETAPSESAPSSKPRPSTRPRPPEGFIPPTQLLPPAPFMPR